MEQAAHPVEKASGYAAERLAPRTNLFLMATVAIGERMCPVRIRNLSIHGALIETANLPVTGTPLTLRRGNLCVDAVLMWADEHRGGINFTAPIALADWLPFGPGANSGQARVDRILAKTRDQLAARERAPAAGLTAEIVVRRHVSGIVADVARRMESLGAALAVEGIADPRLSELSDAAEALRSLERLLSPERQEEIVETIRLDELRQRLEHRTGAA